VPVSENFFQLLGIQPQLGRLFTPAECKWNGPKAVLLSHGLWVRRFGSDPGIAGRTLTINDAPVTVAGVLPASFDLASVFAPGSHFDLYFPFPLSSETNRWGNTMAIIGRLKPGVAVSSARAELKILAAQMRALIRNATILKGSSPAGGIRERPHPAGAAGAGVRGRGGDADCVRESFEPAAGADRDAAERDGHPHGAGGRTGAADWPDADRRRGAVVLWRAGGRPPGRGREPISWRIQSLSIPLLVNVRTDGTVLAFCLMAAMLTGVVFGLAPALQVPAHTLHDALKDTARGSTAGKSRNWIRGALVVAEIAFACVLLVSAGLLVRSFLRVLDVNLGFQPEHAATVRVDPDARYSTQAQQNAYFDEVLRRVRDLPGVQAAGLTDALPLGRNRSWGAPAKGQVYPPGKFPDAFVRMVSDGYIKAMGIAAGRRRDISERDTPSTEPVIAINETMARTLWPGRNAVGEIMFACGERRVVGVVGDVRHLALEQDLGHGDVLPMRQCRDFSSVDLVVRSNLPPAELARRARGPEADRPECSRKRFPDTAATGG
jgi:hypothetical protein